MACLAIEQVVTRPRVVIAVAPQHIMAFAAEQGVLHNWCSELSGIGSEYMDTLSKYINMVKIYYELDHATQPV